MTSINQLVIDRDSHNFLLNPKKGKGKDTIFEKQGRKYQTLQQKNNTQAKKYTSLKEGYQGFYATNNSGNLEDSTASSTNTQNILANSGINSSDQAYLESLISNYKSVQQQISDLESNIATNIATASGGYKAANTNVRFPTSETAYVTSTGFAKGYSSLDDFTKTAGNNNCPPSKQVTSVQADPTGISVGGLISSDPLLTMGTPMKPGQSCGYEGQSVYVNSVLPSNVAPGYLGCYEDSPTSPLLTPVGTGPNYSYSDCQQSAILGGYSAFSLSNVDPTTGYGNCAIGSIGTIDSTKYPENPQSVTGKKALWSSATANSSCVKALITQTGELQLLDANGISKQSFGGDTQTGYLGCYKDNGPRAMGYAMSRTGTLMTSVQNNMGRQYDFNMCNAAAVENNFSYFGLQWNNGNQNQQAQCFLSNDLEHSKMHGVSNNCWKVGDNMVGGAWANAVYSTEEPNGNEYFLNVQDDGNICLYRGTGPNNSQGLIWQSGTNGQTLSGNPKMTSVFGKNGRSYIKTGETLGVGEFIGNTMGTVSLTMQSDGNLVAYTFTTSSSCSTINTGDKTVNVGGNGALALYSMGSSVKGYPQNLGKIGYVDDDGQLREYPASMLNYNSNQYVKIPNADSPGSNIGSPIANQSLQSVQALAAQTPKCIGFVYDTVAQTGYLKSAFAATNQLTVSHGSDLYMAVPAIANLNPSINPKVNQVDSSLYQNYPKGPPMSPDIKSKCTGQMCGDVQKAQLSQLYDSANLIANDIATYIQKLEQTGAIVSGTIILNDILINLDAAELNDIRHKIGLDGKSIDIFNRIAADNESLANAKNYTYMIWSIVALGVVIVTVNAVK